MEIETWQLAKSALELVRSLSDLGDNFTILAYLVLAIFRLNTLPVVILILFCSLLFEFTLSLTESHFFILCSIACSYVTIYYHSSRVSIGLGVMTAYMLTMAQEGLLNAVLGEWFYTALHNSYEVFISIIHLFIILLFIPWRKCFKFLFEFIYSARTGENGAMRVFSVL